MFVLSDVLNLSFISDDGQIEQFLQGLALDLFLLFHLVFFLFLLLAQRSQEIVQFIHLCSPVPI